MKVAENNLFWSNLCGWTLFLTPVVLHGSAEGAGLSWIGFSALGRIFCLLKPWARFILALKKPKRFLSELKLFPLKKKKKTKKNNLFQLMWSGGISFETRSHPPL